MTIVNLTVEIPLEQIEKIVNKQINPPYYPLSSREGLMDMEF